MLITYLLLINATALVLMLADKKKAQQKKWRISEFTLMSIAVLGGSIGALVGMQLFRHKTKHAKFSIGIPVILGLQIIAAIFIYTT